MSEGRHVLREQALPASEEDGTVQLEVIPHQEVHKCIVFRLGDHDVARDEGRATPISIWLLLIQLVLVAQPSVEQSVVGLCHWVKGLHLSKDVVVVGRHYTHWVAHDLCYPVHAAEHYLHLLVQQVVGHVINGKRKIDENQVILGSEAKLLLGHSGRVLYKARRLPKEVVPNAAHLAFHCMEAIFFGFSPQVLVTEESVSKIEAVCLDYFLLIREVRVEVCLGVEVDGFVLFLEPGSGPNVLDVQNGIGFILKHDFKPPINIAWKEDPVEARWRPPV